jgi:hypothetical protein
VLRDRVIGTTRPYPILDLIDPGPIVRWQVRRCPFNRDRKIGARLTAPPVFLAGFCDLHIRRDQIKVYLHPPAYRRESRDLGSDRFLSGFGEMEGG